MRQPVCVAQGAFNFALAFFDNHTVAGAVFHIGKIPHHLWRPVFVESALQKVIVFVHAVCSASAAWVGADGENLDELIAGGRRRCGLQIARTPHLKHRIDAALAGGAVKRVWRQLLAMQQTQFFHPRHCTALAVAGESHRQNETHDVGEQCGAIDECKRDRTAVPERRIANDSVFSFGRRPFEKVGLANSRSLRINIQCDPSFQRQQPRKTSLARRRLNESVVAQVVTVLFGGFAKHPQAMARHFSLGIKLVLRGFVVDCIPRQVRWRDCAAGKHGCPPRRFHQRNQRQVKHFRLARFRMGRACQKFAVESFSHRPLSHAGYGMPVSRAAAGGYFSAGRFHLR